MNHMFVSTTPTPYSVSGGTLEIVAGYAVVPHAAIVHGDQESVNGLAVVRALDLLVRDEADVLA